MLVTPEDMKKKVQLIVCEIRHIWAILLLIILLIATALMYKTKLTLARSRSACLRCLQNRTEEPECGRVTGSPYTSRRMRTPDTRMPFSSHTRMVGSIQSIQPHESAASTRLDFSHTVNTQSILKAVAGSPRVGGEYRKTEMQMNAKCK